MRRRTLIGTVGMLSLAAFIGLFAVLSAIFSPQDPVFAQSNNPPLFASDETTRTVDEKTPWLQAIGDPVTAADGDDDPLTYTLENAGHLALHHRPFDRPVADRRPPELRGTKRLRR